MSLFIVNWYTKINLCFLVRCSTWYIGVKLLGVIIDLRILPLAVQALHSVYLTINSLFMYGHQQCLGIHILPQVPGWLACISSINASRKTLGMAIFSSKQTQPERTWLTGHNEWTCGLNYFSLASLLIGMQSRTSLRTASLLVSDAINGLLKKTSLLCYQS